MLKCIYPTEASKLGFIAATYRSGNTSPFGSCPSTCALLPTHLRHTATTKVDYTYLEHERKSVPRNGVAWSYTHFNPQLLNIDFHDTSKSILNISTDDYITAATFAANQIPTTVAAPANDTQWPRRINNVRFVRCPAETNKHVTCQTCGGGKPLCARPKRDYVIVFVAHGATKNNVGKNTGGCYAYTGNCRTQWYNTLYGIGPTTWNEVADPERLFSWTKSLPYKTLLRHRISGDIGE